MLINFDPDDVRGLSPQALGVLLALKADEQEPFLPDSGSTIACIREYFGIGERRAQTALTELRTGEFLKAVGHPGPGRRLVTTL